LARDYRLAGLERLAEAVEYLGAEFRKFIQK
jgi:hypothetical protein